MTKQKEKLQARVAELEVLVETYAAVIEELSRKAHGNRAKVRHIR